MRSQNTYQIKKKKIYNTTIWLAILYAIEFWAVKKQYIHKISVVIKRTLRWISGNTQKDRIRNKENSLKIKLLMER